MGVSSASVTTEAPASADVAVPARGLESAAQRVLRLARFLPAVLLVLAAVALWMIALDSVQVRRLDSLGLISQLPFAAFLALLVLGVGFCGALLSPRTTVALLVLHVVALIVMLYGASALIAQEAPNHVAWRHAGVIGYILREGTVDPTIDAYFNWPGFFFGAALATGLTDMENAVGLAKWAPVVFNLMYMAPLVMLARSATSDPRLVWLSVWTFYLSNWVGQDYLSPQGLTYFLYLTALAIVLTWFRVVSRRPSRLFARLRRGSPSLAELPVAPATPAQRAALAAICAAVIATVMPTHQLTPFALLVALSLLVMANRVWLRGLPVLTTVLLLAWMSFMTLAYLKGHTQALLKQAGKVEQTVSANVGARVHGDPQHLFVVYFRLGMTALLWVGATVGWIRRRRTGVASGSLLILALAPFSLLALQAYGGEVLLRAYLFSLPFTSFLAAASLLPSPRVGSNRRTALAALAATVVLAGGFLVTRFGNEEIDQFTSGDVRTVDRLYQLAEPGSLLVAAGVNVPWQERDYASYDYETIGRHLRLDGPGPLSDGALAAQTAGFMAGTRWPAAYLIITRSQKTADGVLGSQPWGNTAALERAVEASPRFTEVYRTPDGKIFKVQHAARRSP